MPSVRTLILAALGFVAITAGARAQAPPNVSFTTVYAFSAMGSAGTNADGAAPSSLAVGPNSSLLGTTVSGGPQGGGTVFEFWPSGKLSVLHGFEAPADPSQTSTDGFAPIAPLVRAGDSYLGCASSGGAGGAGTVFGIAPDGTFELLHTFDEVSGPINSNNDGAQPMAALAPAGDGSLYGAASAGGQGGAGVIFRIDASGKFQVVHAFDLAADLETNQEGGHPLSPLLTGQGGVFFGTTSALGPGAEGTVYSLAPDGTITLVHAFSPADDKGANPDGASPGALGLGADGSLYGITSAGGRHGAGTIFRISPDGKFTTIYGFSAVHGHVGTNADGAWPAGALLQVAGEGFYGVTRGGGPHGDGVVFHVTLTGQFQVLYAFSALSKDKTNPDGANPVGGLVAAPDGRVYGTTTSGGPQGTGTIFSIRLE